MGKLSKQIIDETDRNARAALRKRLVELATKKKFVRAARRIALHKAREHCRSSEARSKARAREVRAKHQREATAEIDRLFRSRKDACQKRIAKIRRTARTELERAEAEERELRSFDRIVYRRNQARSKALAKAERRGKDRETDADVELNLDPELVPLWREMSGRFKGSARASRTEQFLHWAHEHPEAVRDAMTETTERQHEQELGEIDRQTALLWELLQSKGHITPKQLRRAGIDPEQCARRDYNCEDPDGLNAYLEAYSADIY